MFCKCKFGIKTTQLEATNKRNLKKVGEFIECKLHGIENRQKVSLKECENCILYPKATNDNLVILKNAEFYSMCEHHILPFFGKISIGYIPNNKVIGVSKLARIADCFAKRLQVQERLTEQIADFLMDNLGAKGVMVVCEAEHLCMKMRGVKRQNSIMTTSAIKGVFKENHILRQEFLNLIKE